MRIHIALAFASLGLIACPGVDDDSPGEGEGEGEGEGDGVGDIYRTQVYRELSAEPINIVGLSTAISGDGAIAAYSTFAVEGVRIFTVPVDGSAAATEVDSFVPGCCGADIALNVDGTVLAWTNNAQLEVLDLASGGVIGTFEAVNGFIKDLILDDVGNAYFYITRNDTTQTEPLERGLYMIEAGTSDAIAIATVTDVSTELGVGLDEIFGYGNAGPTLGVSADGTRVVFGVFVADPDLPGDALLSLTLPAGTLSTLIARVGVAQTAGPGLRHASLSRDGSTVAVEVGNIVDQVDPSSYELLSFDGISRDVVVTQPPAAGITNFSPMSLSNDGTVFVLGDVGHLYRDDGSLLELPVRGGFFSSDGPSIVDGAVYVMDGAAEHFVYVDQDAANIAQLASLTFDDEELGDAPSITSPTISALALPRDGATTLTLHATVAGADIVRVSSAMLLDGLRDTSGNSLSSEVVLNDDGADGDEAAGDGVFTSASVRANPGTTLGAREVRIKAESVNASGRRRATAVDFALLEIVDP